MTIRTSTRRRAPTLEWPTIGVIAACYGSWLAAGIWLWPAYPMTALAIVTLMVAWHSSLMHEASHGHPTRNAALNELLVALPIGLVWPYRRFKTLHLRHHADERLTDPFDDPESYYRALWQYRALPNWLQLLLRVNNTMLGRLAIGPLLANAGFLAGEVRLIRTGDRQVLRAWLNHLGGLAVVLPVILVLFDMPLWLYILVPAYLGQSLIAVRTFAEHQWSERPDGRTIIVERSPLSLLFLNNNLHLVHHKMPNVAWYDLPAQFRARRSEWLKLNGGYAYAGYWALLRDYAFRSKEPVTHPVLRREPELGRAFRPRVRARSVHGAGTAPVPAKPPKE
ncbi:fatty acid desaturase [Chelativorans sp. ZYF759]|uniref:fatty acid desaturase n=1 Tax=Chelativorans sp. ZYF759 TaxID=2692213 RepID=UPI00145DC6A1|nr:fatty acid desaturase [Chelativorans sp. ZYF759]NMG38802.1 fatty acid desaturase [Chelativorans sp. ZYF759]